jgi:glycosyltransferase involved in cell wall biosynthesis
MRILLTTDTIGGVWTFTKELTEGLLSFGHEVALVSLGRVPSESQQAWSHATTKEYGGSFRYEATETPLEWMESNDASYADAEPALLQIAKEWKADVAHVNQFCLGALPLDVPVVVTAHSDVLSWAEVCRSAGLGESAWLQQYCSLVERGLQAARAVVAPTRWMAQALQRGFPLAGAVKVIANGRTLPRSPLEGERRLQAVSVGRRWDEAKNLPVLDGLEDVMPVVIAGETLFGEADALCEDEVMALFRESAIYVATSVYEPFGLAPLEAALCGCAVVANDIASLREVWGEGAIYFNDKASLRLVLSELASSGDALQRAQARSRRRASRFCAVKMVDEYLGLYAELLETSQEAGPMLTGAYAGQV